MRESFIFYRSFYESIKELDPLDQVQIYNAIFEYEFYKKNNELKGVCKSIFTLIIPQLIANDKRYENGKKGGRPKTRIKPNDNQNKTKIKANVNVNDNVNENDNVNVNDNIYSYIEKNFGILISGTNYEDIESWLSFYSIDVLKYAVDISVAKGVRTISYWKGILNNWKGCNYKTLKDIKENEIKGEPIPEWFDKKIEKVDDIEKKFFEFYHQKMQENHFFGIYLIALEK